MKNLNYLHLLVFTMFALCSCSSDSEPEDYISELSKEQLTFPSEESIQTVTFESTNSFHTNSTAKWINVSPSEGAGSEMCKINISVTANEGDQREGIITITSGIVKKQIKVIQNQKNTFQTEKKEINLSEEAQEFEIKIMTNVELEINHDAEWLKKIETRTTPSLKEQTTKFSVTGNNTDEIRATEIHVIGKGVEYTLKIKIQQDFTDRLTIKEKNYIVEAEGADLNIEYKHNNKVSWKSNAKWISEAPQSTSMNNSTITLRIATNEVEEERKAIVTFTTPKGAKEEINILQEAKLPDRDETAIRKVLTDIYNSTNGKEWKNSTNWNTKKSVEKWFGVSYLKKSGKYMLSLNDNNLRGTLIIDECTCIDSLFAEKNIFDKAIIKNSSIKKISLKGSILESFSTEKCDQMDYIDLSSCGVSKLDLNGAPSLTYLNLSSAVFTEMIDLSKNNKIKTLFCTFNRKIKSMNFANMNSIENLDVSWCSQLEEVNIKGCTRLNLFMCGSCRLTDLDLSDIPEGAIVDCQKNKQLNKEIPINADKFGLFFHDQKYIYDREGKLIRTNPYGWWYPGEPESGKHERTN